MSIKIKQSDEGTQFFHKDREILTPENFTCFYKNNLIIATAFKFKGDSTGRGNYKFIKASNLTTINLNGKYVETKKVGFLKGVGHEQ